MGFMILGAIIIFLIGVIFMVIKDKIEYLVYFSAVSLLLILFSIPLANCNG